MVKLGSVKGWRTGDRSRQAHNVLQIKGKICIDATNTLHSEYAMPVILW